MMHALKLRPEPVAAPPPRSFTHPLKGHSGAEVVLHVQGLNSFVRKTAAHANASARLKAQAEKQHALWMMGMPLPKILRQAEDPDGRATFDMA